MKGKPNGMKFWLLGLAALPLAAKLAYLCHAWTSSPVDRSRLWLWGSAAALSGAAATALNLVRRSDAARPTPGPRSIAAVSLMLAAYAGGFAIDVNAVQIAAAVGVLWSAAWALFGRALGLMLTPAAICAVLAIPGSSYWIGNAVRASLAPTSVAFAPAFDATSQPGYIGSELPPAPSMRRFFRTSDARQYRFASPSNGVSVLTVRIGGDVHEIHPVTHCLRSSGWAIRSETLREVALPGLARPISVTEVLATDCLGRSVLTWAWYSSATESTGSFIGFRRLYSASSPWRAYQLSAPVGEDADVDSARRALKGFLSAGRSGA